MMNQSFSTLISSMSLLLGSMLMMFLTNVVMAVSGIAAAVIGLLLMVFVISKSQRHFIRQQKELGSIDGHVEEAYSGQNVIRAYNAVAEEKTKFTKMNDNLYVSAWKRPVPVGTDDASDDLYRQPRLRDSLHRRRGAGDPGLYHLRYHRRLYVAHPPVHTAAPEPFSGSDERSEHGPQPANVYSNSSVKKEMTDESDKMTKLENIHGDISFDHARFGYDPEKIIIKDFSADVKSGQKVAIGPPAQERRPSSIC